MTEAQASTTPATPQDTGSPGLPQPTTSPAGDEIPPGTAATAAAAAEPQVPVSPTTININTPPPSTDVAGIIYSALAGGKDIQPAAAFTPHTITTLGQTLSINNPSTVAIGSSTLSPGGPAITSDGHYYSLAPSGQLVAGSLSSTPTTLPLLTFGGSTYTGNAASQFTIAGQVLTPGGTITVSSTPIVEPTSGGVAIIGGSTQTLAGSLLTPTAALPVLTFDGSTYTANTASQFIIAGQTLTPGGSINAFGTVISEPTSGGVAIIGGSTQTLASSAPTISAAALRLLTFDGSTYTANAASQFTIAGQTLTPGGTITVSGTPISEPTSGSVAVIGTSTQTLASETGANGGSGALAFEGSSTRIEVVRTWLMSGYVAGCVLLGAFLV
ncbi:hypothetical protein P7C71_g2627, partial [Lecanoromycetidae sp. Uapishka_2]